MRQRDRVGAAVLVAVFGMLVAPAVRAGACDLNEDFGNCNKSGEEAVAAWKAKNNTVNSLSQAEQVADVDKEGKSNDKFNGMEDFHDKMKDKDTQPLKRAEEDAKDIDDNREPEKGATQGQADTLKGDYAKALDVLNFYQGFLNDKLTALKAISEDGMGDEYKKPIEDMKTQLTDLERAIGEWIAQVKRDGDSFHASMKKDEAKNVVKGLHQIVDGINDARNKLNDAVKDAHKEKKKAADDFAKFQCQCGGTINTQLAISGTDSDSVRLREENEWLRQQVVALGGTPDGPVATQIDPDNMDGGTPGGPADPNTAGNPAPNAGGTPPGNLPPQREMHAVAAGETYGDLAVAHCTEWGCNPCTNGCIYGTLVPRLYANTISGRGGDPNQLDVGAQIDYTAMANGN